ncbi:MULTISPECIES: hypothetical protein [Microbacterium]|uniref:hypothetical protein n=1 Tax=Microbacterium TaxID=33882 RepID=UPI00217D5E02|nr:MULTISPECIES: hypothetical protein [Microbacterium]UWF77020.1 hypothetical protein JSY13_09415 [Microbacterium neungamense]WCM55180.1 hypothetical protein JRG78_09425 [Microbacterium sp. EF45047]
MDGPVLSGGVIVVVAVLLWALYLMPSWRGRHQYYAAERNAVRLNQALRVLAETSETPAEVRLELNMRTALAQQRLAKRVQAEKANAELERLREELAATRRDPLVRQARARRRVRLSATVAGLAGAVLAGLGVWQFAVSGGWVLLAIGAVLLVAGVAVLLQMSRVARRSARRAAAPVMTDAAAPRVSPPLHDQGPASWTPRPLPQPMVSVAGSRAQAARAQQQAQEDRRQAARLAELRRRAEELAPPAPVRLPAAAETATTDAGDSPYARMGFVDDAEIEAHVRRLLARRAAG